MKKNRQAVTCHDINGNSFEISVDQLSFRPSVYGVIIKDGKVLLSKQWDGYDFPGGAIELGETIHEALIREIKEETGLEVTVEKSLLVTDSFFKLPISNKYVQSILLYYLCHVVGGKISTNFSSREEKAYLGNPEWIDLSELNKLKFYNSVDVEELIRKAKEVLKAKGKCGHQP